MIKFINGLVIGLLGGLLTGVCLGTILLNDSFKAINDRPWRHSYSSYYRKER